MRKVVAGFLGLVVLAVIVGIGGIAFPKSATGGETSKITDYLADFDVPPNGDVDVVETLNVDFPISRHGIFRFFDTRDPNDPRNRFVPEDVSITRDGSAEEYSTPKQSRGRYITYKIGRADTLLDGSHVYRIAYTIPGALAKGHNGDRTQFYWNLIPQGWRMPISGSRLTLHLPADAQHFQCAVGVGAAAADCSVDGAVEGQDTRTVSVATGGLQPNTPVTVKAGLDIPTPAGNTVPWDSRLDPILGRHPVLLGFVLLLSLLAGAAGFALTRSTSEKEPPYPLMYAPPDGVGTPQAAYILTEKVDDEAFVATLMYAAEKGAVTLDQDGKAWTITGTDATDAWNGCDSITQLSGQNLGVVGSGQSFTASPKSVSAGQELKSALSSFRASTK